MVNTVQRHTIVVVNMYIGVSFTDECCRVQPDKQPLEWFSDYSKNDTRGYAANFGQTGI
jgi:hypothetical protein